jgi:hypothetical protein
MSNGILERIERQYKMTEEKGEYEFEGISASNGDYSYFIIDEKTSLEIFGEEITKIYKEVGDLELCPMRWFKQGCKYKVKISFEEI